MKSPNVYVGQYADIRHGAVYTSIDEAVKEVRRVLQPGLMIMFTNLPDADKYWIAGTVGPNFNPKWNLIFTNSSDAEQHMDKLRARGFPTRELICKELKINTKGPNTPDIKTEEHYNVESELTGIKEALSRGLMADNSENMMTITVEHELDTNHPAWQLHVDHSQYAIIDLHAHPLSILEDPDNVINLLKMSRKILLEIVAVDPDAQPRKWARLRDQAAQLVANFLPKDEDFSEVGPQNPEDVPVINYRVIYVEKDTAHILLDRTFEHVFTYTLGDNLYLGEDQIEYFVVETGERTDEEGKPFYRVVIQRA